MVYRKGGTIAKKTEVKFFTSRPLRLCGESNLIDGEVMRLYYQYIYLALRSEHGDDHPIHRTDIIGVIATTRSGRQITTSSDKSSAGLRIIRAILFAPWLP